MRGHQWESGEKDRNLVDFSCKNSNVFADIYSEPFKTSKMDTFSKIATKNATGCLTGLWICLCIVSTMLFFLKKYLFFF